jgi:ribosomal protein S18 acetylase RimI-like enzyme
VAVSIRTFLSSDYAAARALWERTPGMGLSSADEPAAIDRFLARNPGLCFVAEIGGRLIGTILCGHDGRRGLIHHLVVASDQRTKGLGRRLLATGLQALRQAGIEKTYLLVMNGNTDGLAFWRAVQAQERLELRFFSMPTDAPV